MIPVIAMSLRVAAAVAGVAVAVFGILIWQFDRPPFDLAKLQRLQPGMNHQQVRQILGEPKSDYGDHWAYARFMAWPIIYVYFDKEGGFERHEYDP